ncbi:MAG: alpha/beta hydrolase family protein [Gaiellaceae bacterium]
MSPTIDIETPHGLARAHVHASPAPRAGLILGPGAGGGIDAPDLLAVRRAGLEAGWTVVLVEQPYRVAGRRSPAPARHLDAAWAAVVHRLLEIELAGLAHIAGGRSSGARVACRTAADTGAAGVLCLAFPLRPPRRAPAPPAASRLDELEAVAVPTLVVQGQRDPFGMPPAGRQRTVVPVAGDHSLKADLAAVEAAAASWLTRRADALARRTTNGPRKRPVRR